MKNKGLLSVVALLIVGAIVGFYTLRKDDHTSKEGPIPFSAILPLTGPLSHLGENERIGMTLALEDAKAEGRQAIAFSFDDSTGKGPAAVTVVRKRLDVDKNRFFIVATTGPILATLPIFKELGDDVVLIAQTMYPGVTKDVSFAFQIFPSSRQEAEMLAKHAIETGKKRIAALHIQNEWGTESVATFRNALEAAGGSLVVTEVYSFADKDFRLLLSKLLSSDPDALLIYAYPDTFPVVMKQFAEIGKMIPILANADFAIGTIVKDIPLDVLTNTVFPAPRYLYDASNPSISKFNERVRASGHEPNFDIATFYDMTMILNKAALAANDRSPEAFRAALAKAFPYDGVTGHMNLNPDRSLAVEFALSKWVNGTLELVK